MHRSVKWIILGSIAALGLASCLQGPEANDNAYDDDWGSTVRLSTDWYPKTSVGALEFPLGTPTKLREGELDASAMDTAAFQEVVDVSNEEELAAALIADNTVMGRQIRLLNPIVIDRPLVTRGHLKITAVGRGDLIFADTGALQIQPKNTEILSHLSDSCRDWSTPDSEIRYATVLKISAPLHSLVLSGSGPLHLIEGKDVQPEIQLNIEGISLLVGRRFQFQSPSSGLTFARVLVSKFAHLASGAPNSGYMPDLSHILVDPQIWDGSDRDAMDPSGEGPYCENLRAGVTYPASHYSASATACKDARWSDFLNLFAICGDAQ